MNEFSEIGRRRLRSRAHHCHHHAPEVVSARTLKRRQQLRRRTGCVLLAIISVGGVGYFLVTASLAAILAAVGALSLVVGLLVAFGFYVLDNVR